MSEDAVGRAEAWKRDKDAVRRIEMAVLNVDRRLVADARIEILRRVHGLGFEAGYAARALGAVYVLVCHSDCVSIQGVFATLEDAKEEAEMDGEQCFTWTPYNRGEASDIIPPFDQWFSSKGEIDGDPLSYEIWKRHVRRALAALE